MEDLRAAFLSDYSLTFNTPPQPISSITIAKAPLTTMTKFPPVKEKLNDNDAFLSDSDSLRSLIIQDGLPVIKPRPYQKEMLQESLKRNVIVAVSAW